MKRFIREYVWLLSGAFILIIAPPVAAGTMQLFKEFTRTRSIPALEPSRDTRAIVIGLDDVSKQARIVPAFKDGQPQGFKLFSIRPESLFAKLGLQNGDVLKQINGVSLETPETAMSAFQRLREARHVELDFERGGVLLHKTYDVL